MKKNKNIGENCQCFTIQSVCYLLERRMSTGTFIGNAQDSDTFVSLQFSGFKRKFRGKVWTEICMNTTFFFLSNFYFSMLVALMDEGCWFFCSETLFHPFVEPLFHPLARAVEMLYLHFCLPWILRNRCFAPFPVMMDYLCSDTKARCQNVRLY